MILTDKGIFVAKTNREQVVRKWNECIKEFVAQFANNDSEIIVTECGKLKWTS